MERRDSFLAWMRHVGHHQGGSPGGSQAYLEVLAEHHDPLPQEAEEEVKIIPGSEVVTVSL